MTVTLPRHLRDDVTMAENILEILLGRRRAVPGEAPSAVPAALEASTQFAQIMAHVLQQRPIRMTLPAFPCKSPSPDKVCGVLPDEGERLALMELDDLCRRIGEIYEPGATLTICSDGHVFADHIGVEDGAITEYGTALRALLDVQRLGHLEWFDLGALWPGRTFEDKRTLLDTAWCDGPEEVRARARHDEAAARQLRGVIKFLTEDAPSGDGHTRSYRHRRAKIAARHVVSRSQGWGRVIAAHFPNHVRLSIHPQPRGADKLGIRLLDHADAWTTPWHSVVLYNADGMPELVRHEDARRCGIPRLRDGRISHYVVT
ncbi:isocyanide synthase family protein [Rhodococcus sp. SORGH_AS_0301]|uniref:isocyanide synthase family protein n=1 Tax=Rhodococcus sp. SORGH_AS_0301 TaxID=3041780 RepID=UPI0027807466|nr:isocyanide synthase family protein [Rhodococcus sp. SORGH_AS_0301]MDQ1179482.1 pyoverdine/dityrosine biosynthesis protein Dit1 [Rhodococcus sp. SORGH_AS_0301]